LPGLWIVEPTDAALVGRVVSGDVDAYSVLVGRYRDRLARYATRMLGDRHEAEEALQDAFVRAYRSLARCETPDRFDSWLFSILVNRCRTAGARAARRDRTFVRDEATLLGAAGSQGSTALEAERGAWREEIERALARLDPVQREAFLLKHVEDLSYEEMAELTGVGVSALKMRVKRACDRLRDLLKEAYCA
jgi:RNA polymerase sigma-70 factor (ECF subfamily)